MRDFTKLSPAIWTTREFQALSARGRNQYLYILGGPHQTSAGCYHLSEKYACGDLAIKPADYRVTNESLKSVELIDFDLETSEVLIVGWFRDNPPMNEKHYKGILKDIERVRSERLRATSVEGLDQAWSKYILRQDEKARRAVGYDKSKLIRK